MLDLQEAPAPGPVPGDGSGEPDYYLEDARLTRFDASGEPHQRLDTPRLTHTPTMTSPALHGPRDGYWTARAGSGSPAATTAPWAQGATR